MTGTALFPDRRVRRRRKLARIAALFVAAMIAGAAQDPNSRQDGVDGARVPQTEIAMIGISGEGISCVIGGVIGDQFVGGDLMVSKIRPRQDFTLFDLERGARDTVWAIGKPRTFSDEGECERHYQQDLSLVVDQLGKPQIAVLGSPALVGGKLTKPVEMIANDDTGALAMVTAYLKEKGFSERPARIEQAMRVDLDGDGTRELLVNALNTERGTAERGEYSLVLAKIGEGDDARVVALAEDITPETTDYPSVLWENTIVAIVDLDGEGASEVIVYGEFYHGDGWDVIRLKDGKPEPVTFCGCGG